MGTSCPSRGSAITSPSVYSGRYIHPAGRELPPFPLTGRRKPREARASTYHFPRIADERFPRQHSIFPRDQQITAYRGRVSAWPVTGFGWTVGSPRMLPRMKFKLQFAGALVWVWWQRFGFRVAVPRDHFHHLSSLCVWAILGVRVMLSYFHRSYLLFPRADILHSIGRYQVFVKCFLPSRANVLHSSLM